MKILRQERVAADAPQQLTVRCSLTDVFVRDVQVAFVLLFANALDPAALSGSLARVLGDYAPFNARLRRRGVERFIECGATGANFTLARTDRTLAATVARLDDEARFELVDALDARKAWSNGAPVLSVRVTTSPVAGARWGSPGITPSATLRAWSPCYGPGRASSLAFSTISRCWSKTETDTSTASCLPPIESKRICVICR